MSEFPGRVSVVIPAFRVSEYIGETLASVFAQTVAPGEVIVVNDGCPDTANLERALEPFQSRIRYLKQENGGAAAAKNAGIRAARFEWIATVDGDDRWLPHYLAAQTRRLAADPSIDVVACDAALFGSVKKPGERFSHANPLTNPVTFTRLVLQQTNVFTSALSRKQALLAVGLFNENLRYPEDFDLWVRLAKNGGQIVVHDEILAEYRIRPGSTTSQIEQCTESVLRLLAGYARTLDLTEQERTALESARRKIQAELDRLHGWKALKTRDYATATAKLESANEFFRNPRTTALVTMLKVAPGLVAPLLRGRS